MRKISILTVLAIVFVMNLNATVIHVPSDSTTIQAGINGVVDFDTVLVAAGTYTGTGNINLDFLGKSIIVIGESGPEQTIIDCENNGYGVHFHYGEDTASVLTGFTIKNGSSNGIKCTSSSSPTIDNCIIEDNVGWDGGAITLNYFSSPIISNCVIRSNTCSDGQWGNGGGGIKAKHVSNPLIVNCEIYNNTAHKGGGINTDYHCHPIIMNCLIYDNTATTRGGGINIYYSYNNHATVINSTIYGNTATNDEGGGIYYGHISVPIVVRNCIVWGNSANDSYYNNIFSICSDITFSNIEGGWPNIGNINYDPLFVDSANNNFYLQTLSPCIDAGDPTDDFSLEPLPNGNRINMGAYGNTIGSTTSSIINPIILSLSPDSGPPSGGTIDTIVGSGFEVSQGSGNIFYDGIPASIITWSDNQIICLTPVHEAGKVDVEIINNSGFSDIRTYGYTYNGPAIHRVPDDYALIQTAIYFTANGDTVLVSSGTYTGFGNKNLDFLGKAIIVKGESGPEQTIIDCENDGYGVHFHYGEDTSSVLTGFTVRNGSSNGIKCDNSSPIISNCNIENNIGSNGGGIYLSASMPKITYCNIMNNSCSSNYNGGGIYSTSSATEISNCTITNNQGNRGGGVYGPSRIVNCLINSNDANEGGGVWASSGLEIINSTIYGNIANDEGGGIYYGSVSSPAIIKNSILWGNNSSHPSHYNYYILCHDVTFSNIEGGWPNTGNINIDPLFIDPTNNNYHLGYLSPCIDAGNPADDYNLEPLPNGNRINMGAFGNTFEATTSSIINPIILSLSPASGPPSGGTIDTIVGSGFEVSQGTGNIFFDGIPASIITWSDNQIICSTPAHVGGKVDVEIINNSGLGDIRTYGYTYDEPAIHRVPDDHALIQTAINFAATGDTVLVSSGTYTGYGNKNLDFLGKAIIVKGESGAEQTIINCENDGYGVYFHNGEDNTSVFTGFTIRNGSSNGIKCNYTSPIISNCNIENNSGWEGGGIYLYHSSPLIEFCLIHDNSCPNGQHGTGGGGMFLDHVSNPIINSCEVYNNTAHKGGGINADYYCHPIIMNCLIYDNTATTRGGGINIYYSYNNHATVINSTIYGNTATNDEGGGIYYGHISVPIVVRNCIVWGNSAYDTTTNSIYSSVSDIEYSDIEGGWSGTGNIDLNPQFLDLATNNYFLNYNSPCINAGTPDTTGLNLPPYDLAGNVRIFADTVDMGAYESDMGIFLIKLNFKTYLQGPYLGTGMIQFLNLFGFLPNNQPYGAEPWNFNGEENVTAIPNTDIIDWVYIDLRKSDTGPSGAIPDSSVGRRAAFILKNGNIVDMNGSNNVSMLARDTSNLYAVIFHRNHLPIISSNPLIGINGIYTYDFTTGADKVYGGATACTECGTGVWGMIGGNAKPDNQINNLDKNEGWLPELGGNGYFIGDFNMNGIVDDTDEENIWEPNSGKGNRIPE